MRWTRTLIRGIDSAIGNGAQSTPRLKDGQRGRWTKFEMNRMHQIDAKDKPGLLIAMVKHLAGNQTRISFEGDLSNCNFSAISSRETEPSGAFSRNTISPLQDYVILPLTQETIHPILDEVLPHARCVHEILHTEIEKDGEILFSACDNFHRECTAASEAIPTAFLDALQQRGIIRGHSPWPKN